MRTKDRWVVCLATFVIGAALAYGEKPKADEIFRPFNGKDLTGWKVIDFGGQGTTVVENGEMIIQFSELMSGVVYTNKLPYTMNYEITLEARRIEGDDFFCGLTFPISSNCVSLILGGWGGVLTGISSVDYMDASENETTDMTKFEQKRWYHVKVHVQEGRLQVWLDKKNIVDLDTRDRKLSVRPGDIEDCQPFGIATWQTKGGIRNLALRRIPPAEKR